MADPLSVERHIRDAAQELRVIEQEINIWMMQLAKGGQSEIITRDIEADLAKRKDMFARVQQRLNLLEASSRTHHRDREPSPVPHSSTTGNSPSEVHTQRPPTPPRMDANPTPDQTTSTPPNAELALQSIQTLVALMEKERTPTENLRNPTNDSGKSASIESKVVPRFLGFGDAYDHVERFKQICRAYEPLTETTKVASFGLTLDDQAGIWFRTLNEDIVTDFARRGNKCNPIDQLFALKQEANETVRDYIRRTKSLHHRCSPSDKMSDDKLMSRFINGLFDPTLQNFLIARMCRSFTKACTVVMTFEDSMSGLRIPTQAPTNNREKPSDLTTLTPSRPPRIERHQAYAQRENVRCVVCHGHHTGHECPLLHQRRPQYCKWCKAFVMHSQENCWQAPNGRYGQTPMVEHPRSPPPLSRPQLPAILPQQPPLPRIGARLAELEYTTDNQTQVGGGAPDYEDSYQEYGVEEEVLSHFMDFEGDQIPVYVL